MTSTLEETPGKRQDFAESDNFVPVTSAKSSGTTLAGFYAWVYQFPPKGDELCF